MFVAICSIQIFELTIKKWCGFFLYLSDKTCGFFSYINLLTSDWLIRKVPKYMDSFNMFFFGFCICLDKFGHKRMNFMKCQFDKRNEIGEKGCRCSHNTLFQFINFHLDLEHLSVWPLVSTCSLWNIRYEKIDKSHWSNQMENFFLSCRNSRLILVNV